MFLVEPDLISLYRQGRLLVLSFPYSDLKTLPSSLPKQVLQDTRIIPKDMNSILLQILKVGRFETYKKNPTFTTFVFYCFFV